MLNKRNFYINGSWVAPTKTNDFEVINPADEKTIATISLGGQEDTDKAVKAAKKALKTWRQTSKSERLALLEKLNSIYEARQDEMGKAISLEMGAPMDLACGSQAGCGTQHIRGAITTLENFQFDQPNAVKNNNNQIWMEPIGVVGLITPWNWPINQIALKVAPALAAGCTMVLKPSEIAPLSAHLFAQMIDEAGFPAGVFNLVNGDGAGVGTQLSVHKDVDMISFTGSTRAGVAISKNAADTVKRVSLELGGKGANIIFADADENAVKRGVLQCMGNTGQSCNAPSRMFVERSIYNQAVETAKAVAVQIKVDQPHLTGRHLGPVISQVQFDKIQTLIKAGIDEGAQLIAGGLGKPDGLEKGYYTRPTIFADATNQMTIAAEEIFGPVLTMIPFDNEQEVIEMANDTVYGLTNYIQTQDNEKALRVARYLQSGMVEINGNSGGIDSPFGGCKQSGNGREGGIWGLEDFLEVKSVSGINN